MVVVIALFLLVIGLATEGLVASLSQLLAFLVLLVATALKVRASKTSSKTP
jgi:hypothetical protein